MVKIIPLVVIASLNILIVVKLKKVWNKRKLFKEQEQSSNIG
jgi:hypothetical protein